MSKKGYFLLENGNKIEFEFFINGLKAKNISVYTKENSHLNKLNFIKGLEGFRNFIKENVMN